MARVFLVDLEAVRSISAGAGAYSIGGFAATLTSGLIELLPPAVEFYRPMVRTEFSDSQVDCNFQQPARRTTFYDEVG
jgi:hypothetical protein